jgi:hypothetical protein
VPNGEPRLSSANAPNTDTDSTKNAELLQIVFALREFSRRMQQARHSNVKAELFKRPDAFHRQVDAVFGFRL